MQAKRHVGVLGGIVQRLVERHPVEGDLRLAGAADVAEGDRPVAEVKARQFIHAMAVPAAVEDIGQQHGVVDGRHRQAAAGQYMHVEFDIVADLEDGRIVQQRLQPPDRLRLGQQPGALRRRPAARQIEGSLGGAARVQHRDVARPARLDGQRHADQIAAQRIERIGFGVHRHHARPPCRGDPAVERLGGEHQLVCRWPELSRQAWSRLVGTPAGLPSLASRRRLDAAEIPATEERRPRRRGRDPRTAKPSSGSGTGTLSRRRTSCLEIRAASALASKASRRFGWVISPARASRVSRSPYSIDQLRGGLDRRCPARPARCRWDRRPAPARRSPWRARRRISRTPRPDRSADS